MWTLMQNITGIKVTCYENKTMNVPRRYKHTKYVNAPNQSAVTLMEKKMT